MFEYFNFPLILFVLTVVTGALWVLDVCYFRPRRKAQTQDLVEEFDQNNAEALRNGEPAVERARKAIIEQGTERPAWLEYTAGFFPVIAIIFVIRSFMFEPFRIPSGSMMPTLEAGDMILVNKYDYGLKLPVLNTKLTHGKDPARGDVVVFRLPSDEKIDYIKRVVGLPGDTITYKDKQLSINGVPVAEVPDGKFIDESTLAEVNKYIETLGDKKHEILKDPRKPSIYYPEAVHNGLQACKYFAGGVECTVPKGMYFVMGDNRDNSQDSRYWGFVPENNLVGRAFMIWFNFPKFKLNRIGFFD